MAEMATVSSMTEDKISKLKGIHHLHYPIEAFDPVALLKNMQNGTKLKDYANTVADGELNTRINANYQRATSHYLHDGNGKNEQSIIVKALATHLLEDFGAISVRKA